ncbi:acetoacetate--CoA ligase [Pseudonocardia xishanensis]|uniref:Acetoacetate--CoA ligase n=1 Tax=Pseudonocardia xishanensis TaxID=630995 RepID=A0ABP8RXB7_9PSEU
MNPAPGQVMWTPPPDVRRRTRIGGFLAWLAENRGLRLDSFEELWRWSVEDLDGFWSAVWEHGGVRSSEPYEAVLADASMPGAVWFPGARVNYAEHLLRQGADSEVAVLGRSQTRADVDLTWRQLREQVARARAVLVGLGVGRGDRVVGYLPNVPEAVVAFLATASLGAVWATCATEFGPRSVVDRFAQVEPVVLITAGGYRYGRKDVDRGEEVAEIRASLPTLRHVVDVEYGQWRVPDSLSWPRLLAGATPDLSPPEAVPFDHPLFVLFSSGTTGVPKAIVHGHGGILLEHLKNHPLSWDLGPGDRMLWYSTTAWMMWNALVSGLLVGTSIVLLDGDPGYEGFLWQWRVAERAGVTCFGLSPGFLMACRAAGVDLRGLDLSVRIVCTAGAPMPVEGYAWVAEQLGSEVVLNNGSGGTDVCSALVQGCLLLPVLAGRISGRVLGGDTRAFDEQGREVVGEPGELVITKPMPSMPIGLWDDPDGSRLRAAYFDAYPGVWKHGDWIIFHRDGSSTVTGRSDATLNRGGVRMGTAEFYGVVEQLPEVADALVVHLEDAEGGHGELLLFVVPASGVELDDVVRGVIRDALRVALSPRHVPDRIEAVPSVPRNLTGKKLEVPVKRILQGVPLETVASRDALLDPAALDPYVEQARLDRQPTPRSEPSQSSAVAPPS